MPDWPPSKLNCDPNDLHERRTITPIEIGSPDIWRVSACFRKAFEITKFGLASPLPETVATKKHKKRLLVGKNRIKEVNRLIRSARTKWDAHENKACRRDRQRALELYEALDARDREQVPQVLRVWLRYRSEKYFGESRKGNGASS